MTELKTLKDMKGYYEDIISDRCVSRKELKQEAIKWIKEDIEMLSKFDEEGEAIIDVDDVIERWMERFNITDEDLEEQGE